MDEARKGLARGRRRALRRGGDTRRRGVPSSIGGGDSVTPGRAEAAKILRLSKRR